MMLRRVLLWRLWALVLCAVMMAQTISYAQAPLNTPPPDDNNSANVRLYRLHFAVQSEDGWTAEHHREFARVWLSRGDVRRAIEHYQSALVLSPDDTSSQATLATLYLQTGQYHRARPLLEALPIDTLSAFRLGILTIPHDAQQALNYLATAQQSRSEIADLISIIQRERGESVLWEVAGKLGELGEWSFAEYLFQELTVISRERGDAYAFLALARAMQNKPAQAWLEQAYQLAPNSQQVRYSAALIYRLRGEYNLALEALGEGLILSGYDPIFALAIGETYESLNDPAQAEFWYRFAVTESDNAPFFVARLERFLNP